MKRLSYSNVKPSVAVFLALGGGLFCLAYTDSASASFPATRTMQTSCNQGYCSRMPNYSCPRGTLLRFNFKRSVCLVHVRVRGRWVWR